MAMYFERHLVALSDCASENCSPILYCFTSSQTRERVLFSKIGNTYLSNHINTASVSFMNVMPIDSKFPI